MIKDALTKIKELAPDYLYVRFNLHTEEEAKLLLDFCLENGFKWGNGENLSKKNSEDRSYFSKGNSIYIYTKAILKGSYRCLSYSKMSYEGDSSDYVLSVSELLRKPKIKRGESL